MRTCTAEASAKISQESFPNFAHWTYGIVTKIALEAVS